MNFGRRVVTAPIPKTKRPKPISDDPAYEEILDAIRRDKAGGENHIQNDHKANKTAGD